MAISKNSVDSFSCTFNCENLKKKSVSTVGDGAYSKEMSVCYLLEASWLVEAEHWDLVLGEWRYAHSPVADTRLVNKERELFPSCASL